MNAIARQKKDCDQNRGWGRHRAGKEALCAMKKNNLSLPAAHLGLNLHSYTPWWGNGHSLASNKGHGPKIIAKMN